MPPGNHFPHSTPTRCDGKAHWCFPAFPPHFPAFPRISPDSWGNLFPHPPQASLPAFDRKASTHWAENTVFHKLPASRQQKSKPKRSLPMLVPGCLHFSKIFLWRIIDLFYHQHKRAETTTRPRPLSIFPRTFGIRIFPVFYFHHSNLSQLFKTLVDKIQKSKIKAIGFWQVNLISN